MTLGNMRANGVRTLDVRLQSSSRVGREQLSRRRNRASIRPAHGVYSVRRYRCRCATKLERACGSLSFRPPLAASKR